MKRLKAGFVYFLLSTTVWVAGFGCATNDGQPAGEAAPPATATVQNLQPDPVPPGVVFEKDNDLQQVWLAPGFNFAGYDAIYIGPTAFQAMERPNEVEMRALARSAVRDQEVEAIGQSGLFKIVTSNTNDIPAGSKTLKLQNTIIEYEKGGGGARYWAGLFGAGQPVAKVRGLMYDGDQLVFVYEARRSGDSAVSRIAGAYMSDAEIQSDDIRDLAADLAGFMKRKAGMVATGK